MGKQKNPNVDNYSYDRTKNPDIDVCLSCNKKNCNGVCEKFAQYGRRGGKCNISS